MDFFEILGAVLDLLAEFDPSVFVYCVWVFLGLAVFLGITISAYLYFQPELIDLTRAETLVGRIV